LDGKTKKAAQDARTIYLNPFELPEWPKSPPRGKAKPKLSDKEHARKLAAALTRKSLFLHHKLTRPAENKGPGGASEPFQSRDVQYTADVARADPCEGIRC
jgi:hypothetical protein